MSDKGAIQQTGSQTGAITVDQDRNRMLALIAQALGVISNQVTGTWTPTDASGAGLTFTSVSAGWTKIGNMVHAYANFTYPVTGDGSSAKITGLPVAVANANYAQVPAIVVTSVAQSIILLPTKNTAGASFFTISSGSAVTNANLSGATIKVILIYPAS